MALISQALRDAVEREIAAVLPEVIAFRHERHQHPELTWQEHDTAAAVEARLCQIEGVRVTGGIARLGVVGLIEGGEPGPTVALRADMDALPIRETSGCSYASKQPGVMHACGHDGHMANLVGSALVLSRLRKHLKGRVKLIFQPAEEGGAGADALCKAGVLDDPKVDAIFGLHGWPTLAAGRVYVKSGPLLASTSSLKIIVRGTGCHAAMPHLGTDQVLIAARIIEALQMISSRHMAPTEPVALTITQINGGSTHNVIPATVEMQGTLRTLGRESWERVVAQVRRLVDGIAAAHGASAEVEMAPAYPATVNDEKATAFLESVAQEALGAGNVERLVAPTMGGEDFAYYLEKVPGSFFFLGVDDGRAGGYPSLHHPAFDFNDAALQNGMRVFVHAALAYADGFGR
jgi:amidohydrolase